MREAVICFDRQGFYALWLASPVLRGLHCCVAPLALLIRSHNLLYGRNYDLGSRDPLYGTTSLGYLNAGKVAGF